MGLRQIFLDTETTGLDPKNHRIIEFCALEMIDRKLTGRVLHDYFNPERPVDPGAVAVHGLTDAFLAKKSKFKQFIPQMIEFIQDAEVIIHNAPFDTGFINQELQLAREAYASITTYCRITDTLVMAREMYPGQRNSLDALCKRLNVDYSQRTLHGARLDTELLAQVYLLMTGGQLNLFANGPQTRAAEPEALTTVSGSVKSGSSLEAFAKLLVRNASAEELELHSQWVSENHK